MVEESTPEKIRQQQWKYLVENGELQIARASANNTTAALITPPEGSVDYLIGISLTWHIAGAVEGGCSIRLTDTSLIEIQSASVDNETGQIFLTFPIPLKIAYGDWVELNSNLDGVKAIATAQSYRVDA